MQKLVVSCAAEADNPEVSQDYHLLRRMIDNEENFLEVTDLGEELAMQIIRMWMNTACRDLNNYQWRLVSNAIGQCSLPIFVKLVFAEICRWRSYTKPQDTYLASTVMDSIMLLFERVEKQHGRILVFHALAYITAAKSGLSESELEDLISLDDKVLDDVYQYHLPPVRRIPPLLWTRIRNDLPNYLSEREADGVNVMNWYHRQFRDTAHERYFKNMNMALYFHSSIADYYLGIWGGGNPKPFKYTEIQRHRFNLTDKEGSADRKVPIQPLVFYTKDGKVSRYNLRKFGEMPYHLVRSRRFQDLYNYVLFNYEWLHAKLSSCPLQAVLSDFEDACINIEDRDVTRELMLVADALRLGGAILGLYPNMLAPQLVSRLLPEIGPNPNVKKLLKQCDETGAQHCALLPLYHCLHTPGGPLKYSLEGHQFAVFGFCLTSDLRYIVSISNKFITWDLSTSDLTRDVNPGIEGIMQQLVLSPDNRFVAAYTNNNQTVLLNTLTSEYFLMENPLPEGEPIRGVYLLNTHLFVYGPGSWCRFNMRGQLDQTFTSPENPVEWPILSMEFSSLDKYRLLFWTGSLDNTKLLLHNVNPNLEPFHFHSAMVMTQDKSMLYCCVGEGHYGVTQYKADPDANQWSFQIELPRMENDEIEVLLQLKLDQNETTLLGTTGNGFVVWELHEKAHHPNQALPLLLPHGVRNISTRVLISNSCMVSAAQDFVVAGVRMESGQLMKVLDAHFGRIIQLEPLIIGNWNSVITSSIDRTVKVWNINNIFEQVHVIDRHELQIDSISLCQSAGLAVTVTRGCVGVWDMQIGRLIARLADISAESGNILIWNRLTEQVLFKEEQPGVKQVTLLDNGQRFVAISKPEPPAGSAEVIRVNASIITRTIPDGTRIYASEFPVRNVAGSVFKQAVVTCDGNNILVIGADKGSKDALYVVNARTGSLVSKIPLKQSAAKDIITLIPMPHKAHLVAAIDPDKGTILDIKKKHVLRTVAKWNEGCTRDGKYGLYAPSRGGLELLELKRGHTVKTFIPKVAEGVFTVICMFNQTDEYVLYYHSGKKTLRVFRCSTQYSDTIQNTLQEYREIGNLAELSAIESTEDGKNIVLGTVDGCLSVLAIADSDKPEMQEYMAALPSRDEEQLIVNIKSNKIRYINVFNMVYTPIIFPLKFWKKITLW
ncbi:hypothetical protein C0J52_18638 [Blattella germanica]|nr:hypothetical protein C0J52_18638 [Blattella germanica]